MDSEEEKLFSNVAIKEEQIFDPEEDQMQLAVGNGEKPFIKEEAVYTFVVKREVGDGEILENGGSASRGEEEFHGNRTNDQESIFEEEKLFSDVKEEIIDFEEDMTQATKGNGEMTSVKEEALDVKEEVDGEMWANGNGFAGGEPEFGGNLSTRRSGKHPALDEAVRGQNDKVDQTMDDIVDGGNEEKRCPVDGCTEKFSSCEELAKHMRTHPRPMICGVCKLPWKWGSSLREHYVTHTNEKPFKCDVCNKRFAQKGSLRCHQRIHTGELPYACGICDYKTSDNSALKKHSRIHTGERPYSCTICQKLFIHSSPFTVHMRSHTGERPYECDFCDYKATTNNLLKKHKRSHTGEKPYSCSTCGFKTAWSAALYTHKKGHSH